VVQRKPDRHLNRAAEAPAMRIASHHGHNPQSSYTLAAHALNALLASASIMGAIK